MGTVTEEGVMTVGNEACDQLPAQRVEIKMKSKKNIRCHEQTSCCHANTERSERETTLHSSGNAAPSRTSHKVTVVNP